MPGRVHEHSANTHSAHEDRQVAEADRQPMSRGNVLPFLPTRRGGVLLACHHWKRTDVFVGLFRIVFVMVVMRSIPDTRRTQHEQTVNVHDSFGEP